MITKSPYALDGQIITIRKGLAIYKIYKSKFYRVRIWDQKHKRYIVKSTKEDNRIQAREAADEIHKSLSASNTLSKTPQHYTFHHFANALLLQAQREVAKGSGKRAQVKDLRLILNQKEWGLLQYFADHDIREIQTKDFVSFTRSVDEKRPDLSYSSHNQIRATFRRIMKSARDEGIVQVIPETPTQNKKSKNERQEPRAFFYFYPLVKKEEDEWKKLLDAAERITHEPTTIRGHKITIELRDMLIFLLHSFLRPTYSELYALQHKDITFRDRDSEKTAKKTEWLLLTVREGKTGRRLTDTMPAAATVYRRICERQKNYKPDDYVFFPDQKDRHYANKLGMEMFRKLLEVSNLRVDTETGKRRSLYSVRHTSLAMRTLLSEGKVNLLMLAQNAGTSIEMLETFYLKRLPRTKEAVRNLQSFGDE